MQRQRRTPFRRRPGERHLACRGATPWCRAGGPQTGRCPEGSGGPGITREPSEAAENSRAGLGAGRRGPWPRDTGSRSWEGPPPDSPQGDRDLAHDRTPAAKAALPDGMRPDEGVLRLLRALHPQRVLQEPGDDVAGGALLLGADGGLHLLQQGQVLALYLAQLGFQAGVLQRKGPVTSARRARRKSKPSARGYQGVARPPGREPETPDQGRGRMGRGRMLARGRL